jgi:ribonucleoside-diphosphate reductase alpha chain
METLQDFHSSGDSLQPMEKHYPRSPVSSQESEPLSANAHRVLEKRYLLKDETGKVVEKPDELFRRVAKNIASADLQYGKTSTEAVEEAFYQIMRSLEFLPNSPTLMNAGRELQQLSACFVLPVEDSMEGIFETVKQAAIIHKTGGGTGFAFSRLRPKEDMVRTTGGVASGPVSFMKVFNHATEAVKQGGTRRGANMGILRVDHPDILEFIQCKADKKEITNFNISIAITDRFMEAFQKGESYDLINPRTQQIVRQLNAREVMDLIAHNAWLTGEPGLFFIDATNRTNPTPHIAEMEATNPCGEQPLLPYESCNLGSINLEKHMYSVGGRLSIDWVKLGQTIRTCVHFLDNVIDMNRYPIPEIEEITKANRKIGLGIMGFARMLFKLGTPYDSEEGIQTGRRVMKFIHDIGYEASTQLAEERGVYANWKNSMHDRMGYRLRNSYVTTVAPTGTLSMIADTSGGCEPEFSLIWYKNVMDGEHLPYVQEEFIQTAKAEGFWNKNLLEKIQANHGSVRGLSEVPKKWQDIYATSHDIAPDWHVRMQAAFQEYSDSAVSKTINLPEKASVEDVKKAYLLAFKLECKGITVYRDGSRDEQVMNVGKSKKGEVLETRDREKAEPSRDAELSPETVTPSKIKPRPYKRTGTTVSKETPFGTAHITMNTDEDGPAEVFITIGKAGSDVMAMAEGYGRSISLYMRTPSPLSRKDKVRELVNQLKGIGGFRTIGFGGNRVSSLPDAIARALEEHWLLEEEVGEQVPSLSGNKPSLHSNGRKGNGPAAYLTGNICPDCHMLLTREEGCQKCLACGFSEC